MVRIRKYTLGELPAPQLKEQDQQEIARIFRGFGIWEYEASCCQLSGYSEAWKMTVSVSAREEVDGGDYAAWFSSSDDFAGRVGGFFVGIAEQRAKTPVGAARKLARKLQKVGERLTRAVNLDKRA